MPEGDTIFRSATTLRPAMEGSIIEAAHVRDRQFECERIVGCTVTAVEARGKHLLMHLDSSPSKGGEPPNWGSPKSPRHMAVVRGAASKGESEPAADSQSPRGRDTFARETPLRGDKSSVAHDSTLPRRPSPNLLPQPKGTLVIHSHMGMTGSWHVYHPGQAWRKPAHYAALVLAINNLEVICFSPRLLELLTADQLRRHSHLQRLGPDLLDPEFDLNAAVARLRTHNLRPLGEAVMNQQLVAGIGNIYKSEVLFIMGFDPFSPVERFSDEELAAMLKKARYLLQRNSGGPNRVTRIGSDAGRMWVYGNSGRPCPKCGATIRLRRQGDAGRTTCWCPECQPSR